MSGDAQLRPSEAVLRAGHDAYEAQARELDHVSGSPVPWEDVPEPYRSCTIAAYTAAIAAHLRERTGLVEKEAVRDWIAERGVLGTDRMLARFDERFGGSRVS
jgi:hypothetical protein